MGMEYGTSAGNPVIAGPVPAIHALLSFGATKTSMAGTQASGSDAVLTDGYARP